MNWVYTVVLRAQMLIVQQEAIFVPVHIHIVIPDHGCFLLSSFFFLLEYGFLFSWFCFLENVSFYRYVLFSFLWHIALHE